MPRWRGCMTPTALMPQHPPREAEPAASIRQLGAYSEHYCYSIPGNNRLGCSSSRELSSSANVNRPAKLKLGESSMIERGRCGWYPLIVKENHR